MSHQLRLLSLNCWGLKYVSKHRTERIKAIAQELSNSDYDFIALQEIWVFSDYEHIQKKIAHKLPHSKFFYSGALGAGLALFSRFPIVASSVHPYSLNGAPLDVIGGDWFVGKAAASIVVRHPVLGQLQLFNTHLFAKGGEEGPEHKRAHRLVNAWELAKLARQAAELGRYVIALGDFNSIPTTLPMTIIREHAGLSDSWLVTHPNERSLPPSTSPQDALAKFGVTADSPINSYSAGKPLDPYARRFWGKRLDYILYRQPYRPFASPQDNTTPIIINAVNCKVVLTGLVPNHHFSFSDHFGLEATLEIQTTDGAPSSSNERISELSSASITTVIQALTACYHVSRCRSRKELKIFGLCLLLLLGIIIGTVWLSFSWVNPLFFVLTIFLSWLATTMLYEGFLYGQWERNALMNVIEDLEIHSKWLESQQRSSVDS